MEMVEIFASPDDLNEIRKRVAAFCPASLIRRQVTGNHVWPNIISIRCWRIGGWLRTRGEPANECARGYGRTEVRPSAQISSRVDHLHLAKVGVTAIGVIEIWRTA